MRLETGGRRAALHERPRALVEPLRLLIAVSGVSGESFSTSDHPSSLSVEKLEPGVSSGDAGLSRDWVVVALLLSGVPLGWSVFPGIFASDEHNLCGMKVLFESWQALFELQI